MELVLSLLVAQGVMGAFDNLWHHEITEALPAKPGARKELTLHTAREFLYAALFLMLGWASWHGLFAFLVMVMLIAEVGITLWDFIEEDMTRKLPPLERVLHTVLAMNYGAVLILLLPQLWRWGLEDSAIRAADYGLLSWIMSAYSLGVFLWALRDLYAVIRLGSLQTPEHRRHPIAVGENAQPRRILITGATGFIGKALTRRLLRQGEAVTVLTRDRVKAENAFGAAVTTVEDLEEIASDTPIDAIVNLAGEPVIGTPWTKARRKRLLASRIETTRAVVALIERLTRKPACLVNASAVGFYGDGGERELDEQAPGQAVFRSELCQAWEAEAVKAEHAGVRVCRLRFGIVLGHGGGALPGLSMPVRLGGGCVFGSGQQWLPWVHIADALGLITFALDTPELQGPVNVTAPGVVRNKTFMKSLGRTLHRPVWLPIPAFVLKALLGEMSKIFLEGQRTVPAKALQAGYRFQFPTLAPALDDLLSAPRTQQQPALSSGDGA